MAGPTAIGVVVIGRNEGERLVAALRSAAKGDVRLCYVDSNSSDGSIARAHELGATVVSLDMTKPFSAARARNAGMASLLAADSSIEFVQFMDGDCELDPDWIGVAVAFLQDNPSAAIACGRRRERFPERSIYNRLCDMEWNTPIGRTAECGGDFLVRVSAFEKVSGFRDDMIAGEEPELCARLRGAEWTVWRLDCEMTRHDANILTFRQWWRRSLRCGYAYAAITYLHGRGPDQLKRRQMQSAIIWGGVIPLVILAGTFAYPVLIVLFGIYVLQALRIGLRGKGSWTDRQLFGASVMIGKFAELFGIAKFWTNRLRGRVSLLIEYK